MLRTEMDSIAEKPHAVCMPIPAQGHINAMMQLAEFLHWHGVHITFVHSEFNYKRIAKSSGASTPKNIDGFCFEAIPDGLPPSDESVRQDIEALAESIRKNCLAPFRQLITRLTDISSGLPPVTCIISDSFTSYTLPVAEEFQIPDIFFCSISACAYIGFIYFKQLMERGITPLKSESDLTSGYLDTPIDWIPGLKNMRLRDLPSFIRTTNPDDVFLKLSRVEGLAAFEASAIIINTFDELESEVLDAMSSMLPPIYTVGPLSLLRRQFPVTPAASIGSSLLKEDGHCLKWLEEREKGSVVYVSFGSSAVGSKKQLIEFAWGLINSEYDFLWVIRSDLLKDESAALPKELLTEMEGRGLLASWCAQEQVLAHPAVGCFLTHCGWNSMTESISAGVPMICWPYFGDQPTNCRYACKEWGIGMEVDHDVKREQVEGLIKEVMGGEKGKEMRKKVLKWKKSAEEASAPNGSSFKNLERVMREVLLHSTLG